VKRCKEIVVTKNDGSAECLSLAKLSASIARGLRGRAYDARLAGPLARAVAMHLAQWPVTSPPTTEYIFECVCAVLRQTGLPEVADDLLNHRRMRAVRRLRTRVLDRADQPGNRSKPWRKLAVVAALQERYGLRHAVARFLAGQIEAQVFALNYRVITKAFLEELIRNEVLAWGLADEPTAHVESDSCRHPVVPGDAPKDE